MTQLHVHMDIPEIGFIWAKGLYLLVGQLAAEKQPNKQRRAQKWGKKTKYLKAIAGGWWAQQKIMNKNTTKNTITQFYKQLKLELKLKCLQSLQSVAKTPKKIPLGLAYT